MKKIKNMLSAVFVSLLCIFLIPAQLTLGKGIMPEMHLESHAVVLVEPMSGEILYQKNMEQPLPPASVTKLMVMLLTLEALEKEQIKLSDVITASPEACKMGGSQIWLEPGEQMTVSELLKAVCIVSANDASYALAEHLAGSEENFIALMNKRAKELGLKNTSYVNTTGLEPEGGGPGNMTCALDMARLGQEVVKYPAVFQWTGVWLDSLRGGKSYLRNTNNLVRFYRGCDGLKTGFTGQAGFCLVATASRDGVRLIAVAMKSPTVKTRSQDISKLFNYGFSKYKAHRIYQKGEKLGEVKVFRGVQGMVGAVTPQELTAVLKREQQGPIVKKVKLYSMVNAPVRAGQRIGEVILTVRGEQCGCLKLVADRDVRRATFLEIWVQIWRGFVSKVVR
jgi:D-alanyl-D-alanine carboxypeptidase (penicillin-binding protein 5/6)